MGQRLILFSGGVESTAMLTIANPNDIIVVINQKYSLPPKHVQYQTYHPTNAKLIAKHFGFEVYFCSFEISYVGNPFTVFMHQINVFHSILNILCVGDPNITEVWCGLRADEFLNNPDSKALYLKIVKSFKILQPNISFKFPLDHLTKQQQWDMIPDSIKPLVSSCLTHNACGFCKKCVEFNTHIVK